MVKLIVQSIISFLAFSSTLQGFQLAPQRSRNVDTHLLSLSRRDSIICTTAFVAGVVFPATANAGNVLPKGAQQFAHILRLKSDMQGVKKRVAVGGTEIDKNEWDNISKFLRDAYAIGDDMKDVAGGIASPDNKRRALEDVDKLKTYARAGDVLVSKKDNVGFVAVAEKMEGLISDFIDSLSDVPDEI
jgi:hypothetical protein